MLLREGKVQDVALLVFCMYGAGRVGGEGKKLVEERDREYE